MTEYGYCVDFPIVNYVTLAPECYSLDASFDRKNCDHHAIINNNDVLNVELNSHPKSDVWSLGVILFQFLFGLSSQTDASSKKLNDLLSPERILNEMLELIIRSRVENEQTDLDSDDGTLGYEFLLKLYEITSDRRIFIERRFKPIFMKLVRKCLIVNVEIRPDFTKLLEFFTQSADIASNEFIKSVKEEILVNYTSCDFQNEVDRDESVDAVKWRIFGAKTRSNYLKMDDKDSNKLIKIGNELHEDDSEDDHLWRRGVSEVYHLWRLAGGDFLQVLKQNDRLKTKLMPIHRISSFTRVEDGHEIGKPSNDEVVFDDSLVPLSLQPLRNHLSNLSSINSEAYYPILENEQHEQQLRRGTVLNGSANNGMNAARPTTTEPNIEMDMIELAQKQPLNIREIDIEYQFHRMVKFSRYLCGYPFLKAELYKGY